MSLEQLKKLKEDYNDNFIKIINKKMSELEEKFGITNFSLNGYNEGNDEGNEYYEIEENRIQLYIFDSEEEEDYNYNSEKFEEGTRALLIRKYY